MGAHIREEHVSASCTTSCSTEFEDLKIILTYIADYDILYPSK